MSYSQLVIIRKPDAMRFMRTLWVSFDSKSALDLIRTQSQYLSLSTTRRRSSEGSGAASAVMSHRSVTPKGEIQGESVKLQAAQPQSPPISFAASLGRIPFFRQFRNNFINKIIASLRHHSSDRRMVLCRFLHNASDSKTNAGHDDLNFSAMLHVVTSGRLWIFHRVFRDKEGNRSQKYQDDIESGLDSLWERPADFCQIFGSFHSVHYPGNAIFGPNLPSECTAIVEAGTTLIQVQNWGRHLHLVKDNISFAYQCETIRSTLIRPNESRSNLDRSTVLSLLQDGITFFKHIAPKHASKLLETCSVRRFFAGDKLIREGQPADSLYIVLNGFASEHVDDLGVDKKISEPQILCSTNQVRPPERSSNSFGVGDTIGEREVIERSAYFSTVIAQDEVEVIEIRQEVYQTVLWDLCDGKAVPVEKIEDILSKEPSKRDSVDLHELITMLESSDFLQQFPRELQRHLTSSMKIVRFEPKSIVVIEGEQGQDMYIIVSGSAALHSRKDSSLNLGQVSNYSERHDANTSRIERGSSQYGRCMRVLGIGDSFGESAFLHLKEHLATAITRTNSVMIQVHRDLLSKAVWQQLAEFVGTPSSDTMNRIFAKELEDRNENDTTLLVNCLAVNPFFSKMSYHGLIECAQAFRRTDKDLEAGIKMTEDTIHVVNRGSLLAMVTDGPPIPLHPICFGSQTSAEVLKSRQRPVSDQTSKQQFKHKQRSSQLWKTMQSESQYYGIFVVIKLQDGTRADTHLLNVAVRLMARYSLVTIDCGGTLRFLNELEFHEIGLVRDVSRCWRQQIIGFRFALAVAIASETVIFASNSITDGKKLMDSFCSLSPFLKEHYARNSIVKSGSMWLRLGDDLKFLNLSLSETGKLSYTAQKDLPGDRGWFDLCDLSECSEINFLTWKDLERHGLELRLRADEERLKNSSARVFALLFSSQKERDQWADVLCLYAPHQAHLELYSSNAAESESYEDAVRKIQGATLRFVKWIASTREKALSRMFVLEADRALLTGDGDKYNSTIFIGYGSAFNLSGICTANEGTEVVHVSLAKWGLIERHEHLRQVDKLTRFLEKLPTIKLATKKDLASLSSSASASRHCRGDTVPMSCFGDKHVVLIQEGVCALGKVPKRLKSFRSGSDSSRGGSNIKCAGTVWFVKFSMFVLKIHFFIFFFEFILFLLSSLTRLQWSRLYFVLQDH
jgi:CRP-like cAMP-binding protein